MTITYLLGDSEDCNPKYARLYNKAALKDRNWFKTNPFASHRIRSASSGELRYLGATANKPPLESDPPNHPGYDAKMIVTQIEPGWRIRKLIYLRDDLPYPPEVAEAIASIQADNPGELINSDEIMSKLNLMGIHGEVMQ